MVDRIGTRSEGRNWRQRRKKEAAKKKAKRPQGPPPPDFATLLKLAEQKQIEPVELVTPLDTLEKKKKEPERLMTKKEKKVRRADGLLGGEEDPRRQPLQLARPNPSTKTPNGRIPKLSHFHEQTRDQATDFSFIFKTGRTTFLRSLETR